MRNKDEAQWVVANIYSGEIAAETARYASMNEAAQVLHDLVQHHHLAEGDWEVRQAAQGAPTATVFTPNDY